LIISLLLAHGTRLSVSCLDMVTDTIPGFEPKRIVEVEIGGNLPRIETFDAERGRTYRQAFVAVRLHTQPLGTLPLELPAKGLTSEALAAAIWEAFGATITRHLTEDGLEEVDTLPVTGLPAVADPACLAGRRAVMEEAPFVSVIVATRDRPESLALTLDSLLALDYPNYEIVVVDNAPRSDATACLIRGCYPSPLIRYVREARAGLSWARNRGVLEAAGEILAFTDDDIVVDRHWLTSLAEGFAVADNVGCVTGLVLPAELETSTQQLFEQFASFSRGFESRIFDLGEHRPPNPGFPYLAGMIGAGCSMAFRADVIRSLNGFNTTASPGMPSRGGEDLYAFFEVIYRGFTTVYHSGSLAYHRHRSEYAALSCQVHDYGIGFVAYQITVFRTHPRLLLDLISKAPVYLSRFIASKRLETLSQGGYYPPELRNLELRGMLLGPLQYIRSIRRERQIVRDYGPLEVRPKETVAGQENVGFESKRVVEVEIGEPLPVIKPYDAERDRTYHQALIVVRLHRHPLGLLPLPVPADGVSPSELADTIWDAFGSTINRHLEGDGLGTVDGVPVDGLPGGADSACLAGRRAVLADAPFVSVIVATRDRPDSLIRTLESLLAQDYPAYEIIVVDNAPRADATARLFEDRYRSCSHLRYLREDRPGASSARNRGILAAQGEILAFTDDDIVVDRDWLVALVEGFSIADNVGCVTGLVLPAELDTPDQQLFEQYASFTGGFEPLLFDLADHRPENPLFPYMAGMMGPIAAFRADVIRSLHGFNPALGPGMPASGGEDLFAAFEVIHRGFTVAYQQRALEYHHHRSDRVALRRQVFGYGTGFLAYLTAVFLAHPLLLLDIAGKVPVYLSRFISSKRLETLSRDGYYPPELRNLELQGMLLGPFQYLRSLVQAKRIDREFGSLAVRPKELGSEAGIPGFEPKRIVEVEIGKPLPDIEPYDAGRKRTYRRALIVVRLHSHPIGVLPLAVPAEGIRPTDLAAAIWDVLGSTIVRHLSEDGITCLDPLSASGLPEIDGPPCLARRRHALENAPLVSVIVATRDRPESLARTLESLLALDYPNYEIIVVDNAPGTAAAARLVRERFPCPMIRYVREDRAGLSWARNRGTLEAIGEILAFTDDDVVVDRQWLSALVEGFARGDNVGCVTGLGLPAELETPTQQLFEQYGGFRKGFEPRVFDRRDHPPPVPTFPYSAGTFGAGCNMAFRAGVLRAIGGFDPILGAGTPTGAGEDFRAFLDVIVAGKQIVYQPAALVYHRHRPDSAALRRQLFANGTGLVAYLISTFCDRPMLVLDFASKAYRSWQYLREKKGMATLTGEIVFPRRLRNRELRGMAAGPAAYVRGVLHYRRIVRRFGALPVDEQ